MQKLILASSSPRRKALLQRLNIPFTVEISHVEEKISPEAPPDEAVMSLALQKAKAVASHAPEAFVIGADTMVSIHNQILGKPKSREEAKNMLKMLSGQTHSVYTGTAIVHGEQQRVFYERTDVTFWTLPDDVIDDYLNSGESFDKAGAYGIQGLGSIFVKEIHGDFFSVVGLPIARVFWTLKEMGYRPFVS
ncbi:MULTISPECIES: Maf family protein [Bacillus]|jgi:septum formation protein|uniref:Maf family protein n=1 Tax=Bacillus TaxID=1386 RepID=UPI00065E649F|nr:Maf family protein [Bacillus smithii]AKP47985.1 Septum formation protein Maf [Bacillus smithii]MED4883414.1 Maf family protein [Bacillus smithii]MED4927370.1 Maf family protein [Bacillus smithii]